MILIVGLGNPGKKYENTRHNIGFQVIGPLQNYSYQKKFDALLTKSSNPDTVWALPQTFMNKSGISVTKIANFYKIDSSDIWVVHDDIDLSLGTLRINQNISSAGHKGIESIIEALGTNNFIRFRVGINSSEKKLISTESFVLQPFTKTEELAVSKIVGHTVLALKSALEGNLEQVINKYSS